MNPHADLLPERPSMTHATETFTLNPALPDIGPDEP